VFNSRGAVGSKITSFNDGRTKTLPATGTPASSRRRFPARVNTSTPSLNSRLTLAAVGTSRAFAAGSTAVTLGSESTLNVTPKSPPGVPSPDGNAPENSPSRALTELSDNPSSCSPETSSNM